MEGPRDPVFDTTNRNGSHVMSKLTLAPRNPYAVAAKFRKSGPHRKSNKAMRRAANAELRMEGGRVARHPAFTRTEVEFESHPSHHSKPESVPKNVFWFGMEPSRNIVGYRSR